MTPAPAPYGAAPAGRGRRIADALTAREWDQLTDGVLRRIEDRVTVELARRGRRMPKAW